MNAWKKLVAATGLALLGAMAPAAAQTMSDATRQLYEAAKAEREVTWYVSHFGLDNATAVEQAFYKKYPGIKVNVVRATAQVIYQRLNQDILANTQVADVYSSTDNSHFVRLKSEGRLMAYRPENADKVLPAFRNMDADNQYHATSGAIIVIAYRTDKFAEADAPKTWTDLLDPKFKGKLSFGHPAYSGFVGAWAIALEKKYGWSYFEKLRANNPQIGRSINDVITMLDAGERSVGHAGDGPFRKKEIEGAPYRTVFPEDGSVVILAGSGILKNSKRPNAAKLFMDFLLDVEPQQIRVDMDMGMPLRPEVKNTHGGKMPGDVNTIPVSDDDLKALPALNDRWRRTFGG
jgi:iron(III) transport system substrate-binding protein